MPKAAPTHQPLLSVSNLKVAYPIRSSVLRRIVGEKVAVRDVTFEVKPGETVGLVGESGSGKSTVARSVIGLIKPDAGAIGFNGHDITRYSPRQLKSVRREMQMVFQDPYASLNPRLTVRDLIAEGWRVHRDVVPRGNWTAVAQELMERVGLNPDYSDRYAHQFSGGQRQRIGIARALALKPKLIICDEAVSALDVSVQAQVLNLLQDLQEELGLAYLFISHDLSVVEHLCARVLVLHGGEVVEEGSVHDIFDRPQHDYTKALLAAVPVVRPWLGRSVSSSTSTHPERLTQGGTIAPNIQSREERNDIYS
ncbi:ABC transporter ATP-binding protein [Microvirga puerhi]|uniref:ATP-binding cassette domain-containing protein n=1 Tax=Microvirga puerhi TaxID=2876078 RepID=A0ABS7VRM8_9HYPH|nr:ATP-binding cassette domain-containing protein [Microvirga puerhi]MBZ6078206.1 ATP-binding cassette domain-containing protein [Microvirga puerhi]